ncbi:MAG: Holliday junction DNA helicase RuvA [Alphaproteobacteria bacterium 41-28]|nr:MAG: Holliday junction DNA helicase RuvA [Alphaproteobacteria bacterium 41-28]
MTLLTFENFSHFPFEKGGRFLGCDVGEKTIGLALSDTNRQISTPFQVIQRTQWKRDSEILLKTIIEYRIVGVVVGLPLNMNGSEGPRCQSTRQFVANLLSLHDLPVCLWDERLSTIAVTRTLLEADLSRTKRGKVIDKVAASYILQGFLDAFGRIQQSV